MRLQLGLVLSYYAAQNWTILNFRTASDLEEIGMIDKYQKGYIKDLIISGDSSFQAILEKYEKGDKRELEGDIECLLIDVSLLTFHSFLVT